ncbi:SixA phosphatase family protein [Flavisolibacter ginsengisoli]|jgi:phosphohistidine phosphatase|uniref:Phosphohistidine phosphatase n=1 Tax=Flavisolibacter ginsengisoli DSM 18119 TaxID=1121884 RepID=A0A1M4ZXC3_9BACT|nr:histidine phosphatase family protein [Flavisolibacter ginsengisoli]SHF22497.1 phosphohistidine phosphatase [Flavisolibacter ginsengisoli DSM 18119]
MKTLLLIRHAKSSWDAPGLSDADRPLNDRGKKDAPEMAKRLKKRGLSIDQFISSTAKRARKTAKYFAEEFDVKKEDIKEVEDLYMANAPGFVKTIEYTKKKHDIIALFSHNPGITEFANSLTHVRIDDMPTCSVFAVQAEVNDWEEFMNAEKKFLFFDYPGKSDSE